MAGLGRGKKKDINWELAKKLCGVHCIGEEVAAILECDYDTLNNRIKTDFKDKDGNPTYPNGFRDFFRVHSATGRASLRRKQFEVAMEGHPTMLVWLGKQYLEQTDKTESSIETNVPYSVVIAPASEYVNNEDEDDE